MDILSATRIIKENYTLSELEDRLNAKTADFDLGIQDFIESNSEPVYQMLEEDLWLLDGN